MCGSKGGGGFRGDELRHPRTSCIASMDTKISGGYEDWALVTARNKSSYHTVRQQGSSRAPKITGSKIVNYTQVY